MSVPARAALPSHPVIRLDAATVLLQWAVGGLLFLWVTTRGREVGIGYGWLVRSTYIVMALGAFALGVWLDPVPVRDVSALAVAAAAGVALGVSIVRRKAGVSGQQEEFDRRSERVAAMTGIERTVVTEAPTEAGRATHGAEFPPVLDLIPPLLGVPGLVAAGLAAGDPALLSVARVLVGAAFLGSISDGMLLGHWYLVQPGLARKPLLEMVRWTGIIWPFEIAVLIWPIGMLSVLAGTVDDGYGGLLGWFWLACAVATLGLLIVTRAALRERYYSAVMAATGLLYLAILTAFGMDIIARAVLAPG